MPQIPLSRPTARLLLLLAVVLALLPAADAHAESECVADPADDVVQLSDGSPVDVPEADIVAMCSAYDEEVLEVTVRVVTPTDPVTDDRWADFATAIGLAIETTPGNGDYDFDLNYGRWVDTGSVEARLFPHPGNEVLCTVPASFDGVRYRFSIPRDCIDSPATASVASFVISESNVAEQESQGVLDEVPPIVPDDPEAGFVGPYDDSPDPATGAERLAGASRVDTAIEVSRDTFLAGSASAVVLARADSFPDALAAAPLAVARNAPLLLTPSVGVASQVETEIERVLAAGGTVYLSGGTAALSDDVAEEVEDLGYVPVRIAGGSRYETAVAIAEETVAEPQLIVLADGNDFPDALIGGSLAAARGGVEVLTNGEQLHPSTTAYLDDHPDAEVVAIGATAAAAVPDATPHVGDDAFATSVLVAELRYPDAETAAIASGTNFPDGLTGGAHAGSRGIPLLLSTPDLLSPPVSTYLSNVAPLQSLYLYGGVAALSYQVESDAASALTSP